MCDQLIGAINEERYTRITLGSTERWERYEIKQSAVATDRSVT
jgi:hypothetical protein